jgi:hypothetical protein
VKHVLGDTTTTLAADFDLPDWYTGASDTLENKALKSFPAQPEVPKIEVPPASTEPLTDAASKVSTKFPTLIEYLKDETVLGEVGEKAKGALVEAGERATKAVADKASSFSLPSYDFSKIKSSFDLDYSRLDVPLYKFDQLKNFDLTDKFQTASSEKIAAIKESFTVPTEKLSAVAESVRALVKTQGWTIKDLVGVMNLEELGGWYGGAFALFLIMVALGQQPVRREYQPDLEGPVMELKGAVTALAEELKEVKAAKASTDSELTQMKTAVKTLEGKLEKSAAAEAELRTQVKVLQGEKVSPRVLVICCFAFVTASSVIRKSCLITSETHVLFPQKDVLTEKIQKMGSKAHAVSKEPDLPVRKVFYANVTTPAAEPAVTEAAAPSAPKEVPVKQAKKATAKKTAKKKVVAKKTEAVKAIAPKKAPKKAPAKTKTQAATATDSSEDWSKLSTTALKRKTVKELTTYLKSKGTSVTDADGKTLKKADLVELVLSVLV